MTARPFHHGNLRAVLIEEAARMVRESGLDALSLRELARRAGVSHGAPRSHFIDRQALLDALAQVGFERLNAEVQHASVGAGGLRGRFLRVARAYVSFAVDDAELMELMFQTKTSSRPGGLADAAEELFASLDHAIGPHPSTSAADDDCRDLFKMLFAATMQGIAALITSHRIDHAQGARLVETAVDTMLESKLGVLTLSAP